MYVHSKQHPFAAPAPAPSPITGQPPNPSATASAAPPPSSVRHAMPCHGPRCWAEGKEEKKQPTGSIVLSNMACSSGPHHPNKKKIYCGVSSSNVALSCRRVLPVFPVLTLFVQWRSPVARSRGSGTDEACSETSHLSDRCGVAPFPFPKRPCPPQVSPLDCRATIVKWNKK